METLAGLAIILIAFCAVVFGAGRTFGTLAFVAAVLLAISVWGLSSVLLVFAFAVVFMLAFCIEPLIDDIRQGSARQRERKLEEANLASLGPEWKEALRRMDNEIAFDMWKAEGNIKKEGAI